MKSCDCLCLEFLGISKENEPIKEPRCEYATSKVTKYQRCNFIIQIHKFTIKIDTISINLLFECVKIVEFNFNSHVFLVMYQEIRFANQDACFFKSRRETTVFDQLCFREGLKTRKGWNLRWLLIVSIFQMQVNFSKVNSPFCSSAGAV